MPSRYVKINLPLAAGENLERQFKGFVDRNRALNSFAIEHADEIASKLHKGDVYESSELITNELGTDYFRLKFVASENLIEKLNKLSSNRALESASLRRLIAWLVLRYAIGNEEIVYRVDPNRPWPWR